MNKIKKSNQSWRNLSFVGLVQVAAFFTILLSIITLFDEYSRYIELFSHFKFQYLLASIICACILTLYKNYKFTIALLCTTVLNAVFVVPWYFADQGDLSADDHHELTLLQSNVLTGNDKFEEFIELVNQEKPDLISLQEVNEKWLYEIRELENEYPYKFAIPQEDNFGIALFSKYPFESVKKVVWGDAYLPSIEAQIVLAGINVSIITTHPLPPVGNEYYRSRNSQINSVAQALRNQHEPLILVGDLNTTMWSTDYAPLEQGTGLRNARKGFGILPTWPTQFPLSMFMISLDHVLVSSHFIVKQIKVGNDIGSDHLPLIVKLGLVE